MPITQSFMLYHAMRDNGVKTQLIAYPVDGHAPSDPVHQRDVGRRWAAWLNTAQRVILELLRQGFAFDQQFEEGLELRHFLTPFVRPLDVLLELAGPA